MAKKTPYALIIMDGYGLAPAGEGNAISLNGSKNINALIKEYPSATLGASGLSVGLPDGQMGNSEVGHLNMGAGRIVYQDLTKITKSINDGDFFKNPALCKAMDNAKKGKKLHLYGLLSDGGVHSHLTHVFALLKMAKAHGVNDVFVHCFMDGRDVSPTSGADFIRKLQSEIKNIGVGKIASVCGRYYAMDRDNNWDRVELAYDMLTLGTGEQCTDPAEAVKKSYAAGVTDEFIKPVKVYENGKPLGLLEQGDSVICFNFRPDRAREITRAVSQKEFIVPKGTAFERKTGYLNPVYVCFTVYDAGFEGLEVAFPKTSLDNTLGEYLAKLGKKQLRIAETEKYAHVTFFFNGGVEEPNEGEDRILVKSPKVATYDLQPEMSAPLVCDKLVEAIRSGKYDVIIVNFANPDMVGHTGVETAAIQAIETVDACVGRAVDAVIQADGVMFLCADHGNAEQLIDYETGAPFTAHTTNPVPFILINDKKGRKLREGGCLADIAPTLIELMEMEQPKEMTAKSLLL